MEVMRQIWEEDDTKKKNIPATKTCENKDDGVGLGFWPLKYIFIYLYIYIQDQAQIVEWTKKKKRNRKF